MAARAVRDGGVPMKAYVLVETSAGKTKAVKKALTKVKPGKCRVESLDAVTGPFDYIAVVEGPTLDDVSGGRDRVKAHPGLGRAAAGALAALLLTLAAAAGAQPAKPNYLPYAE